MVAEAKKFATAKHKNQYRKFSGEAYIEHPKRVAQLVLKYKDSSQLDILMVSALLHDTVEDTDATINEIEEKFGTRVGSLVLELTSEECEDKSQKRYMLAEKMCKMSSWALVIKLCDRLDNVSDLRRVSKGFRDKYISETKYILSHLIVERELTRTHVDIISDILKEIVGIEKLNSVG